jgi:hypothetical protein
LSQRHMKTSVFRAKYFPKLKLYSLVFLKSLSE